MLKSGKWELEASLPQTEGVELKRTHADKPSTRNDLKRDSFQPNFRSDLQLGKFRVHFPSVIALPSTLHHLLKDLCFRSLPNLCPLPPQETRAAPGCAGAVSASQSQKNYFQVSLFCFSRQLCSSGSPL